jgi:hypothetical protein
MNHDAWWSVIRHSFSPPAPRAGKEGRGRTTMHGATSTPKLVIQGRDRRSAFKSRPGGTHRGAARRYRLCNRFNATVSRLGDAPPDDLTSALEVGWVIENIPVRPGRPKPRFVGGFGGSGQPGGTRAGTFRLLRGSRTHALQ